MHVASHSPVSDLISVIIPVYNRLEYIPQAITSVMQQTYPAVEIIVVDDGSQVDVSAAIADFGDHVTLYRKDNGGPASARNFGIERSRGSYLLFLDDDDILEKTALQRLWEAIHISGSIWAVGRFDYINKEGRRLNRKHCCSYGSGDIYAAMVRENLVGAPCTVLAKAEIIRRFGGFDISPSIQLCEDYDLWFSISRDHRIAKVDEIVASYRLHPTNASQNEEKLLRAQLFLLEKHKTQARPGFENDFNQSFHKLYRDYGDHLYLSERQLEARSQWLRSLSYYPHSRRAILTRILKSYIPHNLREALRGASKRVRSTRERRIKSELFSS